MRVLGWAVVAALSVSPSAVAQAPSPPSPSQPYAGLTHRPVKALSPEQVQGLRMGQGMAMALPAELNRYPGPMHALDHADQLQLTAGQRDALARQMQDMRRAAIALGERLIAQEAELDALFASATADAAGVDRLTAAIGATQAALRAVHLKTHLQTRATLSDAQVEAYVRLRGYGGTAPPSGHGGHGGHGSHQRH